MRSRRGARGGVCGGWGDVGRRDAAVVKQWKEDMGYAAAVEKMKEGVEQYGGEVGKEEEREA